MNTEKAKEIKHSEMDVAAECEGEKKNQENKHAKKAVDRYKDKWRICCVCTDLKAVVRSIYHIFPRPFPSTERERKRQRERAAPHESTRLMMR